MDSDIGWFVVDIFRKTENKTEKYNESTGEKKNKTHSPLLGYLMKEIKKLQVEC